MSQTHTVKASSDAIFTQLLDVQDQDMRRLYEKAKRDQWNASTDIDWDAGGDPDCGILPDGLIDIYGTPYWDRLDDRHRLDLNRHFSAWRISQLMYGEQFALMVCGQIANVVPGIDSKFFMATQVADEARHSEVLARYLYDKVGVTYPLTTNLKNLFDHILAIAAVVSQDRGNPTRRGNPGGVAVSDAGRPQPGPLNQPNLSAHPFRRIPPYGFRDAEPARPDTGIVRARARRSRRVCL